jgi:hypothetical protein
MPHPSTHLEGFELVAAMVSRHAPDGSTRMRPPGRGSLGYEPEELVGAQRQRGSSTPTTSMTCGTSHSTFVNWGERVDIRYRHHRTNDG